MAHDSPATTHFGYRTVHEAEKAPLVKGVFDRVARRYDVMNDVMSLGLHRRWKESLIDALRPTPGMRLLDLAGGTGDIAFRARARCREVNVTLCDINYSMLHEGRDRAVDRNEAKTYAWVCGDGETLPFADSSFNACTLAFGLRNMTHVDTALSDIHRVLKPGGHFLCLEFSPAVQDWLKPLYEWYSFTLIPRAGKMIAGDAEPYQYLVESIRRFPPPERLAGMMKTAGFSRVRWRPLAGGAVALHEGWRV